MKRELVDWLDVVLNGWLAFCVALIGLPCVFAVQARAADIPSLFDPPGGSPELINRHAALAQERSALRVRTESHNSRCRAVEEGTPLYDECASTRGSLVAALNQHIQASNQYNEAVLAECSHRQEGASKLSDLQQRFETDKRVINNFGFEQNVQDIQAWAEAGEEAQKKARSDLVAFAVDGILDGLKVGIAATPALSQVLSDKLVAVFQTLGFTEGDKAYIVASRIGGRISPQDAEMLANRIEQGKKAYDRYSATRDLVGARRSLEIAQALTSLGAVYSPKLVPLALELEAVSLTTYGAEQVAAKHQIEKLTTMTELQLQDLATAAKKLKNDAAELGLVSSLLKSHPACDSTGFVRR